MHPRIIQRASRIRQAVIARLPYGCDLSAAVLDACRANAIRLGYISVIGAVRNVSLALYDQDKKKYKPVKVPRRKAWEIVSCTGNVSLRDGTPFVHLHGVFSDSRGTAYGGHILEGTVVFAAEVCILELSGRPLRRGSDAQTGLWLWQ